MKKRVLVTGASGGIGKAVAIRLAADGFEPVLHYHKNRAAAEGLKEELAAVCPNAQILNFDVCNAAQTKEAIEADMREFGTYFGVVCNAGITADAPFPLLEPDMWRRVIAADLDGFYNVLHPVVMPMVSNRIKGRIVAISSVSGEVGNRGQVNYSAAKAGVIGAVKALALELAKRSITVNCVSPGVIKTRMTQTLDEDMLTKMIPMRRFGTPEEVAGAVSFLMGPDASYITRQVISVNGGLA